MHGGGQHFIPLDGCIAAMKQTGMEMSDKFKETSLSGLAVPSASVNYHYPYIQKTG